ncbi:MAG: glycoside hydrolase family 9 protein [Spirochaetales bacterium]|nr:glycoside hydrolase family 9 protein [Spirochaetales bacterium]
MRKGLTKITISLVILSYLFLTGCSNQLGLDSSSTTASSSTSRADSDYNYGEALQKSIMFYEFQRSGDLDEDNQRNNWRGDSAMDDGEDEGVDLTGGWYDAGDHVKFNLPMAYTATMLAWSVYELEDAYIAADQYDVIMENIQWATDYFIKCHVSDNEYYYQVGDGSDDHAWWGSAEVMQMDRPAALVDSSSPGSTVVAETAAALASAAVIFEDYDSDYSDECLSHAETLYDFAADTLSDSGYTAASGFYSSWSGYYDELAWAAVWLYIATGDETYMDDAETWSESWGSEDQSGDTIAYSWGHCWDDVHYGAQLLMARETSDETLQAEMKESMENHLDYWLNDITYTPLGLAWLSTWGSLRYATTTAFLALIYSDWDGADQDLVDDYQEFAKSQVDYALGDGGQSYLIGFGDDYPEHPHHRTSHGSYADSQSTPDYHRHTLVGALVGGPDSSDDYTDDISDYISNEVACDYNAGITGALAWLYNSYGGDPIEDLDAIEDVEDEMYVTAGTNSSGDNYLEVKAYINNVSSWPARMGDALSFKYFFDLTEEFSYGYDIDDITITTNYCDGGTVSGPYTWDADEDIYYVDVDFTGTDIYPGGQSYYRKEVQFRMALPSTATEWDNEGDYSYEGISSDSSTLNQVTTIPVYDDGELVYGEEPGEAVEDTEAPEAPTGLTVTDEETDSLTIDWDDNSESDLDYYNVYISTTSGFTLSDSTLDGTTADSDYTVDGLDDDTTYYFAVTAVDTSDNESDETRVSGTTELFVPDTTAPDAPSGLTVSDTELTSLTIEWTANTEDDLDYYNVYVDGTLLDTTSSSSYEVTDLDSSTTYELGVSAVDTSDNESDLSTVNGTTDTPDTTAPAVPEDLSGTATSSTVELTWSEVSDSDLSYYNVYRGSSSDALNLVGTSESAEYSDESLSSSTVYYYAVSAVDSSENESDLCDTISVETEEADPVYLSLDLDYTGSDEVTNSIGATFTLSNDSGEEADLSTVTIRYYMTNDSTGDVTLWCDYAGGPISGDWDSITDYVSGSYEDDSYMEISFTSDAGSLKDGGYAEIQTRITASDWSDFDQSDDYSYNDADKVVIMVDGVIVWGTAP